MSTWMTEARTRVPRFAEAAVERARLTVVPRAATRRASRMPFWTLVSVLLVGGIAGLLWFNTSMQQVSFEATALEQRAHLLDAQRQSLQLELERLRDPQRVAAEARQMGMVPAAAPAFLRLSDGTVLGKPVPATGENGFRITPAPAKKPRRLDPAPVIVEAPPVRPRGAPATAQGFADGTKRVDIATATQRSAR